MILTFAVNGTLLDETPFLEQLKALAEEPQLDAERVVAAYHFYQARLQYGQAYQNAKSLLKQTLMLMDVEFNDRGWFARHYDELLTAQSSLKPYDDVLTALPILKRRYQLYALANTDNDLARQQLAPLTEWLDGILTAEQAQAYQPNDAFFERAAEKLDFVHQAHVHVASDYWQDIMPSAKRGWHNVWINRENMANSRMYKHNKALPTLAKLPDYIARVTPDMEERLQHQLAQRD